MGCVPKLCTVQRPHETKIYEGKGFKKVSQKEGRTDLELL